MNTVFSSARWPRSSWCIAALVAGSVMGVGCFDVDRIPQGPPTGYETNAFACEDGRDNDNDGLIDCQDPDCIGRGFCGELIELLPPSGTEFRVEECIDRLDNDSDGQFDCGDRGCQAIRELCCVTEFSDVACSNGIDDDGNGFADCEDFACRSNPYVSVCDREFACDDGRDNDGDGEADCLDSDCAAEPHCGGSATETTTETCTDGIDNDGNGYMDCRDFSCCSAAGVCINAEVDDYCGGTETSVADCTDGIDNNRNGYVDCADRSCCTRADNDGDGFEEYVCPNADVQEYCDATIENTLERCTDGLDNDGNGYADCSDNSCSGSPDPMVRRICEADYDSCRDGLDNDGDGYADCADYSCRDVVERRTFVTASGEEVSFNASPCSESVAAPLRDFVTDPVQIRMNAAIAIERCTDGIDGDSDGFVDCDDFDCQWNPVLNPRARDLRAAPGLCQGGVFDPSLNDGAGAWREPREGDVTPPSGRPNVPLLCQ